MYRALVKEKRSGIYQTCDMILLLNVYDEDQIFRDHVWVKASKHLSKLKMGVSITFDATRYIYKSSRGYKTGLKFINKLQVL